MRFLTKKQVKELVTLSFVEMQRRERAGKFPKRRRLSSGTNRKGHPTGRVFYVESEVQEWMADQLR